MGPRNEDVPKNAGKRELTVGEMLRTPVHEEHGHVHQLTGTFADLEGIEHDSHAHRHEFVGDDEDEDSEDDAVIFLDQEGHEVREFHTYEFTEKNPGCWIFGHGEIHVLPPEFTNPLYIAQFTKRISILMMICLISRSVCLSVVIFIPQVHHAFFTRRYFDWPLLGSIACFLILTVIINLPVLEKYIRHPPLNVIIFILTEIAYTSILIGVSLFTERTSQNWLVSIDLFKEYRIQNKSIGYPGALPENYPKFKITPAFFFISANIQVTVNLAAFVILTVYTKYWMGSKVAYQFVFGFTATTSLIVIILLFDYSYASIKMYDRLQLILTVVWTLLTSYLFIHYIERVVEGKILRLYGMRWRDVCNAGLRLCFL